jgi:hypothetical protein
MLCIRDNKGCIEKQKIINFNSQKATSPDIRRIQKICKKQKKSDF